jgi:hypothetical protein
MTLFFPVERATLLIPSGTEQDPDRKHLFILLNNPVTDEKVVLLVSLSSLKAGRPHDPTCIIEVGETGHEFISRTSFVDYSKALIEPASKLSNGVSKGVLIPKGTIEREVFARILAGVVQSPHTPHKCKLFYRQHIQPQP